MLILTLKKKKPQKLTKRMLQWASFFRLLFFHVL